MRRLLFVMMLVACSKKAEPPPATTAAKSAPASTAPAQATAPLTCRELDGCTSGCTTPACAEACVARLTAAARPVYDALQKCVVPACASGDGGAAPCASPGSFGCKMCVLGHCASEAAACMKQ